MMDWGNSRLISGIIGQIPWANSHAQVPTLMVKGDRLRVFFATRPKQDTTLTTYCDLAIDDDFRVVYVHDKPILELGGAGAFDQYGIMPSAITQKDGLVYLYYSGWSRSVGVPYTNYTGVAVSEDGGDTFKKVFSGPVLDRTPFELYSATSPEVYTEGGKWHMWYCAGTHWHEVAGKLEHTYDIKYASSGDGLEWRQHNQTAIAQSSPFEAITKPSVLHLGDKYGMWYCYRGTHSFRAGPDAYRIGYAESVDLSSWKRMDDEIMPRPGDNGWDSEMMAYPAVIRLDGSIYMFYNGNGFGRHGFGYTKLTT